MHHAIEISNTSRTPKYLQLADYLSRRIENRSIANDEQLPSINVLSAVYDISRDTAHKAYMELKRKNLVEGVRGKGYYIKWPQAQEKKRVFFLMNKLSAHKKILFDAFMQTIGQAAEIDLYIYNNHYELFERLLIDKADHYTHYVIIPHFYTNERKAIELINHLPKDKLLLLDKKLPQIGGRYACVYQDFEKDIFDSMTQARRLFDKYRVIKLIFPNHTYQPREIIQGFQKFCIRHHFQGKLVPDITKEPVAAGEAYVTMMEDDLVELVKKAKQARLRIGKEVGILSYNENPLKEILLDGITVMSTDFEELGRGAARMILDGEPEHRANPFRLIVRNSL